MQVHKPDGSKGGGRDEQPRGSMIRNPQDRQTLERLRAATPARIGMGRFGVRYPTAALLKLRADHARAVDAVWKEVSSEFLEALGRPIIEVHSRATNKEEYLTRPDLGRRLSDEAMGIVQHHAGPGGASTGNDVLIIAADGLSATAIEANLPVLLPTLSEKLKQVGLNPDRWPVFFVHLGRVWIMDHIGELLKPAIGILLIGERPGLITSASLSAYLVYQPNLKTKEPQRNLISNIHDNGVPPGTAALRIASIAKRIAETKKSGVELKL